MISFENKKPVKFLASKAYFVKVHIFWEGQRILRNLHQLFDIGKIIGGDFANFCGLLRIYELYYNCAP